MRFVWLVVHRLSAHYGTVLYNSSVRTKGWPCSRKVAIVSLMEKRSGNLSTPTAENTKHVQTRDFDHRWMSIDALVCHLHSRHGSGYETILGRFGFHMAWARCLNGQHVAKDPEVKKDRHVASDREMKDAGTCIVHYFTKNLCLFSEYIQYLVNRWTKLFSVVPTTVVVFLKYHSGLLWLILLL